MASLSRFDKEALQNSFNRKVPESGSGTYATYSTQVID